MSLLLYAAMSRTADDIRDFVLLIHELRNAVWAIESEIEDLPSNRNEDIVYDALLLTKSLTDKLSQLIGANFHDWVWIDGSSLQAMDLVEEFQPEPDPED